MTARQFKSHSLAREPLKALILFEKSQTFEKLPNLKAFPSAAKTPISERKLRVACTSDLFDQTTKLVDSCPPADVLIIAGNLSRASRWSDLVKFRQSLSDLPVKHKIFVPGSADLAFNLDKLTPAQAKQCDRETIRRELAALGLRHLSEYFSDLIYLEDRGVELCGVKFFGSPWVSSHRTATFFCPREKIITKWNAIPRGIDVLITCQPPLGHGDADYTEEHLGDVDLLGTVTCRLGTRFHVFGYSREAFGISFNGQTYFINAAMCTRSYHPSNELIVFDVPMPEEVSSKSPSNVNYFLGLPS